MEQPNPYDLKCDDYEYLISRDIDEAAAEEEYGPRLIEITREAVRCLRATSQETISEASKRCKAEEASYYFGLTEQELEESNKLNALAAGAIEEMGITSPRGLEELLSYTESTLSGVEGREEFDILSSISVGSHSYSVRRLAKHVYDVEQEKQ